MLPPAAGPATGTVGDAAGPSVRLAVLLAGVNDVLTRPTGYRRWAQAAADRLAPEVR